MLPLALTGVEVFADAMESLVNQTEDWRKVLEGLHSAEDVHKKTAESKRQELDDDHHGMLASGYFHV